MNYFSIDCYTLAFFTCLTFKYVTEGECFTVTLPHNESLNTFNQSRRPKTFRKISYRASKDFYLLNFYSRRMARVKGHHREASWVFFSSFIRFRGISISCYNYCPGVPLWINFSYAEVSLTPWKSFSIQNLPIEQVQSDPTFPGFSYST